MLANKIYFKGITYNEEEITKRVYKLKKFFENLAELALNDNNDFCYDINIIMDKDMTANMKESEDSFEIFYLHVNIIKENDSSTVTFDNGKNTMNNRYSDDMLMIVRLESLVKVLLGASSMEFVTSPNINRKSIEKELDLFKKLAFKYKRKREDVNENK